MMPQDKGKRVGILGGSFNPPHEGHRYISLIAMDKLSLDEVWWLINPCNPFKNPKDMLPLTRRVDIANDLVKNTKIKVTAFEQEIHTRYTYDTLLNLRKMFPNTHFVWLMGDDLLPDFVKWERWEDILNCVDVAVFTRLFKEEELDNFEVVKYLKEKDMWNYIKIKPNNISSTKIRAGEDFKKEFMK